MAARDKYEDNKRYFETLGVDRHFLTFDEIKEKLTLPNWVLEDVTANRAWANTTVVQSFGASWRSAGYQAKLDRAKGGVWFIKEEVVDFAPKNPVAYSSASKATPMLDINTAVSRICKLHMATTEGEYTRYRSWAHCYKAFREYRHDKENIDLLCLHLAWYMASWGMLRGSSYLLKMDYFVHKPLVRAVVSGKFDLLFDDTHGRHMIPLTIKFTDEIQKAYGHRPLTDTFITKLILGIFGTAPAFDRFFRYAAIKYSVCSGTFNKKSLGLLWDFYEQHNEELEKLREFLVVEDIRYTPMKMLDMCLFQIGIDELGEETEEGND